MRPSKAERKTDAPFTVSGQLLVDGRLERGAFVVHGRKIVALRAGSPPRTFPSRVLKARYISPGFVDLQTNGGFGVALESSPDATGALAAALPKTGVTAFLPTLVSLSEGEYAPLLEAMARQPSGAHVLGAHVEGPFLSQQRAGAHRLDAIRGASGALFRIFSKHPAVRMVTLAPEEPGALQRIRTLVERGVRVGLGHTEATYEQFRAGVDAGARFVTHLFNAMSPFHHRAPGAVGAALSDPRVTAGVIADGIHAHPAAVQVAYRALGADRLVLVTDAMAAAGMPPGKYALGGQQVTVTKDSARLADGTLAGSTLTLDQAIRNAVEMMDIPLASALHIATAVPARVLGLSRLGKLSVGAAADFVALDKELRVLRTFIGGASFELER